MELVPLPSHGTETLSQAVAFWERADWDSVRGSFSLPFPGSYSETLWSRLTLPVMVGGRGERITNTAFFPAHLNLEQIEYFLVKYRSQGFRSFKWKWNGEDPGKKVWAFLLQELLPGEKIRIDGNCQWTEQGLRDFLIRWGNDPRLDFVEEPLGSQESMLFWSTRFPGVVAWDESVTCPTAAEILLDRGAVGPFVVKPSLQGDAGVWKEIARKSPPEMWVVSSALDGPAGCWFSLKTAGELGWVTRPVGFGIQAFLEASGPEHPLAAAFIELPDRPWNSDQGAW